MLKFSRNAIIGMIGLVSVSIVPIDVYAGDNNFGDRSGSGSNSHNSSRTSGGGSSWEDNVANSMNKAIRDRQNGTERERHNMGGNYNSRSCCT